MPLFYFNLHECGTTVEDEEGRFCENVAEARDKALEDARGIMASEVMEGKLCLACRLDVLDEGHALVLELPFAEAVDIEGLPADR